MTATDTLDLNARVDGAGSGSRRDGAGPNSRRDSAGPPVVLLHGLFGAARNWNTVAGILADRWQVHALDLRNHGDSPWAPDMAYEAMAADVARYVDRHDLAPAAVVGHSMGGKVAMALALAMPERVARLVVADIAPVAYPDTHLPYIRAMQAVDPGQVTRRSEAGAALADTVPDPSVRAFLLQNLVPADGGGYRWRLNLAALADQIGRLSGFEAPAGARYTGPTLFLAGGASDYIQPADGAEIARLFPTATRAEIAGAGHWVHAEAPEAFVAHLVRFLGEAVS